MNRHFTPLWRLGLLSFAVLGAFGLIGLRLYHLQVLDAERFASFAEQSRRDFTLVAAQRGDIRDSRGMLLATSEIRYEVGVDPTQAVAGDARYGRVARILDLPLSQVVEAIRPQTRHGRSVQWVKLAEDVPSATYRRLMSIEAPGVYGSQEFSRVYPGGEQAAHLLGYVNGEGVAVDGVERIADFYLRGQDGWRITERDGQRQELSQYRWRDVPARPGADVELTLDGRVQSEVERAASRLAERFSPKGLSIIVSEVSTGRILALTNRPTFDPNEYNLDVQERGLEILRNRAIADFHEPGSVLKVVPMATALEYDLVRRTDWVDCGTPVVEYRGRLISLPKDTHPHGTLSVEDVLVKSSNRGAAHIGMLLGRQGLDASLRQFGFGESTGLGLPGESAGLVHDPSDWDGLTITRLPMGHAIAATAMQVHFAMSAIANDGLLLEPCLIERIEDHRGMGLVAFEPTVRRRVVSPETAREMAAMLERAASAEGTAREAQIPGYRIAGKTGTSQKIVDGRYSSRHHVATFSGFFPSDRPLFAITVQVDEPDLAGVGYGGRVAAPAFREVAEALIQIYQLPPATSHRSLPLASLP